MKDIIFVYKKIIRILNNRQRIKIFFLFLASVLFALFETIGVSVILPLTEVITSSDEFINNRFVSILISIFKIEDYRHIVAVIIIGTIVIYLFKNSYFIFFSWLKNKVSTGIGNELSSYMLRSYMNRGYLYFVEHNSNVINQGIAGDASNVYTIISNMLLLITKVLIILFIGIYMLITDWQLAIGLLVSAVACLVVTMKVFKPIVRKSGELNREYSIRASRTLWQTLWGIKELMASHKQKRAIFAYERNIEKHRRANIVMNVTQDSPIYVMEMFCVSVILIVLYTRILKGDDYSGFVGVLASFAIGAFRILPAVGGIASYTNIIVSMIPSLDAVHENLVESREYNKKQFNISARDDERYRDFVFSSNVSLKNITFAYNEENGNVIENLNMTIFKGQSVGFVGESGAGKSTLSDIILGVISPDLGQVLVDDVPITAIPNRWGEIVGFVPQQIYLADTTIKENVAFFEDLSDIDDSLVIESLKKANVWEFICTLPDGIETRIGDQGVRLSGGQRQRIGIARALYHQPEILVLDEATSALDNETEKAVMEAIDSLKSTMTLIIIAHRLTTIKNCDVIYEIKEGKAIERKYEEIV